MKTKREIATLYFPDITPKSASEKLTSWINNCKPLVRRLSKTGYKSGTHTLSDRQISIIFDYLGEPWEPKGNIYFSIFFLLIFYYNAQIINLLTNEIHSRKSVRKYAILAHSATLWLSEHCKTGEKLTVFFRPKSTEKPPEKHWYWEVKAWILQGNNLVIAWW